jgi:hypothetical protein
MIAWATVVYLLCLATSLTVALLLLRSFMRFRTRILAWCAACFVLLALNNLFVVLDMLVFPDLDLSLPRLILNVLAVGTLMYGFVWELDT